MNYYDTHTSQAERDADTFMELMEWAEISCITCPGDLRALTSMHRTVERAFEHDMRILCAVSDQWDADKLLTAVRTMRTWVEI